MCGLYSNHMNSSLNLSPHCTSQLASAETLKRNPGPGVGQWHVVRLFLQPWCPCDPLVRHSGTNSAHFKFFLHQDVKTSSIWGNAHAKVIFCTVIF